MKDNDILSKRDFIKRQCSTGRSRQASDGLFLTALLGLIVGGAIVGQTVYAIPWSTSANSGHSGPGARNSDLYKVIFSQSASVP